MTEDHPLKDAHETRPGELPVSNSLDQNRVAPDKVTSKHVCEDLVADYAGLRRVRLHFL